MRATVVSCMRNALLLPFALLACSTVQAQTPPEKQQPQGEDVVRVSTELVQTDVTVVDKKGHFVDGLKPEQFVLKIDNKPMPIFFFERVAGPPHKPANEQPTPVASANSPLPRAGRSLIFFIDDLHLSPGSLARTRKALLQFIEEGLAENDKVAITSSSGQIGFLQQFMDDRVILRSAVARLNYRSNAKPDSDNPAMSEYAALRIREGDEGTISYYVSDILRMNSVKTSSGWVTMITPQAARQLVIERAQQIVSQTAPETDRTLLLLEGLMRTAAQLPGRKVVFLISDGFYLNDRNTGSREKIKRVTESAGRAGVVIYTLDARGLVGDSIDVVNNRPLDSQGLMVGSTLGELSASQDGLNAIARDTGGGAFRNTNLPMAEWIDKVLDESANYYLLAWRPDTEEQKRGKFNNIEVAITDRPDLTVRLRRGYFKTTPLPILTTRKKSPKDPVKAREDDMRLVIDAPVSQQQIPTDVGVDVLQVPGVGTRVSASVLISREALAFDLFEGKQAAEIDIGGILYDDKGKPKNSFVGRLRVFAVPQGLTPMKRQAVYNFQAWLPSGLYQVRVGVRDIRSGKIGSAMEWVRIPELSLR